MMRDKFSLFKHKTTILIVAFICVVITCGIILTTIIIPNSKYNTANELMNQNKYYDAYLLFEELGDFKNSYNLMQVNKYNEALRLLELNQLELSKKYFYQLGDYKDAPLYFKSIISLPQKSEQKCEHLDTKKIDTETATFSFDNMGNMTSRTNDCPLYPGHCVSVNYSYKYDESGNIIEEYYRGEMQYSCKYNNVGKLEKTRVYRSEKYYETDTLIEYSYDNNGNLITEKLYEIDRETETKLEDSYCVRTYNYKDNICVEKQEKSLDSQYIQLFSYDAKGNLIKCTQTTNRKNGSYTQIYEFTYGASGNILTRTCKTTSDFDEGGTDYYSYRYDEIGNCIKAENGSIYGRTYSNFKYLYIGISNLNKLTKQCSCGDLLFTLGCVCPTCSSYSNNTLY